MHPTLNPLATDDSVKRILNLGLAAAAVLVGVGLAMWWVVPAVAVTTALGLPLATAVAYLAWRKGTDRRSLRSLALVLLIALIGLIGVMWITIPEAPDIDVLNLHVAAADALLDGKNPYVEARAPNTSPVAPDGARPVPLRCWVAGSVRVGERLAAAVPRVPPDGRSAAQIGPRLLRDYLSLIEEVVLGV